MGLVGLAALAGMTVELAVAWLPVAAPRTVKMARVPVAVVVVSMAMPPVIQPVVVGLAMPHLVKTGVERVPRPLLVQGVLPMPVCHP